MGTCPQPTHAQRSRTCTCRGPTHAHTYTEELHTCAHTTPGPERTHMHTHASTHTHGSSICTHGEAHAHTEPGQQHTRKSCTRTGAAHAHTDKTCRCTSLRAHRGAAHAHTQACTGANWHDSRGVQDGPDVVVPRERPEHLHHGRHILLAPAWCQREEGQKGMSFPGIPHSPHPLSPSACSPLTLPGAQPHSPALHGGALFPPPAGILQQADQDTGRAAGLVKEDGASLCLNTLGSRADPAPDATRG